MPAPSTNAIDLDAYLQRIGYEGERIASLPTLEAIHACHTRAIAFENLSPLLGQPVVLDLPSLQQKLVNAGRGGYCFEQNGLFRPVLVALGFQVTSLAARVLWGVPKGVITPRSHMLLLVHIDDEPYIADVGFGGLTLATPIRLIHKIAQSTSHEPFRLIQTEDTYVMQTYFAQTWQSLYQFDLQPQHPSDYEVSNWYVSTYPKSPFVNSLIASRLEVNCRYTLRDNRFTTHSLNGATEHRVLTTAKELCLVLTHEFRLTLPDHPAVENALHRLIKSADSAIAEIAES
ncbi:MAG: arylamine N-acetyltransferase [Phormidesmis priestleyi]|uniref:Arylamine N-acetyltransferase n=1 Tax=Phormidesmis priestleyi TaxID=268141 RepID=A0A2W4ZD54_9CYAN|nr:MAG: arylamine N-acetyltransferase [Phormidesmis priestleyi]